MTEDEAEHRPRGVTEVLLPEVVGMVFNRARQAPASAVLIAELSGDWILV